MSLYQKYRPYNFEDVVGQDQVVDYLNNIIIKAKSGESIPHAYIFSGSHGIGKTTLARIFARELGINNVDIVELDAASTSRKIENMRELIDSTSALPVMSKYKVYILDEAHALTKDASNAFLKTLEEPFTTNIFILCTTSPESLLATVKSRCNIVNLITPKSEDIIKRLQYIIDKENIKFKVEDIDKILNLIAENSNRSYRDSITNLERVVHTFDNSCNDDLNNLKSKQEINFQQVSEIFKINNYTFYKNIFIAMIDADIANICKIINDIFEQNQSPSYNALLDFLRGGMLMKQKVEDYKIVKDNILLYEDLLLNEKFAKAFNSRNLLYFLEKEDIYKKSNNKELAWIAICGNFVEERLK